MSEESKIISLSDRARRRKGPRERSTGQGARGTKGSAQPPAGGEAKPAQNAAPKPPPATTPVPAQLIWLYCPACRTLEYTELALPNGRIHQPCGTQVEESVVDVDARAEYSLAELNLRQLERLAEVVDAQRGRFREYQQRLELAAHQPLSSYPLTEDTVRLMPVAEVDPLGLLISPFLRQPLQRFRPEPEPEQAPSTAPTDSAAPPTAPADSGADSPAPADSGAAAPAPADSGAPSPDSGKPAP